MQDLSPFIHFVQMDARGLIAKYFPRVRALSGLIARVRRVFDVGADIATIDDHLSRDPVLAPFVARRPGLRVSGGWDGFELAVRAILSQQATVNAACKLAEKLCRICGTALMVKPSGNQDLAYAFPSPGQVAGSDLRGLDIPRAQRVTLKALAEAASADRKLFWSFATIEEAIARFQAIEGIGENTAH